MAEPALDIRDLRFAHRGGGFALHVPAYRLGAGEQALLAGGSGRGKSTLLQLVAGLRDVDAGSIEVAGIRMSALAGAARDRARGQRIGMIFQTFNLLQGFSALENVMAALMFGDSPAAAHAARAQELLGSLGIPDPSAPV
ncbi:MAG: ATP-binding cassette domain-containing protein, partial [Phycisphaerales bacterium]